MVEQEEAEEEVGKEEGQGRGGEGGGGRVVYRRECTVLICQGGRKGVKGGEGEGEEGVV